MQAEDTAYLTGVGVGPGDPELVTLGALRAIKECDAVILPDADPTHCRAWQIAAGACPEFADKPVYACSFPMTRDREKLHAALDEIYASLSPLLRSGRHLAFLTIGDPSIYSTFSYMAERAAAEGFMVRTIGGVAAFSACAASLGIPLVLGDEALHVIPGTADFQKALLLEGTKVFMKLGKRLPALKAALREPEAAGRITVRAIENCGPDEIRYDCLGSIPDTAGYMLTVIVRDRP